VQLLKVHYCVHKNPPLVRILTSKTLFNVQPCVEVRIQRNPFEFLIACLILGKPIVKDNSEKKLLEDPEEPG
jgi:hypothetical protein